jgi:3-oxoacyl-[acyl-carrier protein] reductase
MKRLLEGKTAIVTGASKGIGRATAELFAEDGANVVLTARGKMALDETVAAITSVGGDAVGVLADSADPQAPKIVFAKATETFGQVAILINNVGYSDRSSIEESSDERFEDAIQINYFRVFGYCREAFPPFLPRNEGVIVNVASVNGTQPICGVAYTSAKGAMNTITKNIAIRASGTSIRCNAIAPGVTETPMAEAWPKGELPGGSRMLEFSDRYDNLTAPATKPINQAYAALYLARDMGRAVTGQIMQVDNGAFL